MNVTDSDGLTRAAMFVEHVTIRNFKGIRHLKIELQPGLSLLVGRNNAGKSRILRALHIAVGGTRPERDDLTVGSPDPAEIEVVLAPRAASAGSVDAAPSDMDNPDDDSASDEVFDLELRRILGEELALVSDTPVRQRFAWRTTISLTGEGSGARSQWHVLAYNAAHDSWQATEKPLSRAVRNLVYAEMVDTRRDLDAELRQRGTAIRRILNNLQVPEDDRENLEQQLAELGADILQHSDTLRGLRGSLDALSRYVDALGEARVDPVPRTLEELARTVGVSFDDGGAALASRLHGSGVRSLASLVVQEVFYGQTLGADGASLRPHPVTLIEEPEAHLHPHAVSEVASLLERDGRQVVATTHSPMLAASVTPIALLLVRRSANDHSVLNFGPAARDDDDERRSRKPSFYRSEMEKLKRLVERPFGELLFANAVVIVDGSTERAFLPPVLRDALGSLAHGVSVIDSAGMDGQAVPAVVKFARHVEIPFIVFADYDKAGKGSVERLINQVELDKEREVVWAANSDAEQSDQSPERGVAIEKMMIAYDRDVCVEACRAFGETLNGDRDVLAIMKRHKGSIGSVLARQFIAANPYKGPRSWPEPLNRLVDKLNRRLSNETSDVEV